MVATAVSTPCSYTVHRLSTTAVRALLVVVAVWAALAIVGSALGVLVVPAPVVLVVIILMVTRAVRTPRSSTVHRLGATRRRAGLVVVRKWTTITIVSSIGADLIVSAPPVLVVRTVMVARSIRTPSSSTIHGLRATTGRALLIVVVAVHRLRATRRGAILLVVAVWASRAVVCCVLSFLVLSAASVLVLRADIAARSVRTPSTDTMRRLGTSTGGAAGVTIAVWAVSTAIHWMRVDTIVPAPPVGLVSAVVRAAAVRSKASCTVNTLRTATGCALLVAAAVRAAGTIVRRVSRDTVRSALPVHSAGSDATAIAAELTNAVHWLRAPTLCAILLTIAVTTA